MAKKGKPFYQEISDQERVFCEEYVLVPKAPDAAEKAGYCRSYGARLIKKRHIIQYISRLRTERSARVGKDADYVLSQLAMMLEADFRDLFNEDLTVKHPSEFPDNLAAVVASVEVEELWSGRGKDKKQIGEIKKIKFWDKTKLLDLIGKHVDVGAYRERKTIEHNHTHNLSDTERESRVATLLEKAQDRKDKGIKPEDEAEAKTVH